MVDYENTEEEALEDSNEGKKLWKNCISEILKDSSSKLNKDFAKGNLFCNAEK